MRKIKTFESFEKDIDTWGLSTRYLFETCHIQEVLDMLFRVAMEIIEDPKSLPDEVVDDEDREGQVILLANIGFGPAGDAGNSANVQIDKAVLEKMSIGFDDLTWQYEGPVDKDDFDFNSDGSIAMSMELGVVYNVGTWDPTMLDATSNAFGVVSELLEDHPLEWEVETIHAWDL